MKKIKLLTSRSGPDGSFGYGEIIELLEDEANRMILTHQAEPVAEPKRTATKAATKRTAAK